MRVVKWLIVILLMAFVAGCAGKGLGPEKTRLAAAILLKEAQVQFRQAAVIFDQFCDRQAATMKASELAECADWVRVVSHYKLAYPVAVAALQASAGGIGTSEGALEALLKVKNEIIRLLIFRGVEPVGVTPTLGACTEDPPTPSDPQAPRRCPRPSWGERALVWTSEPSGWSLPVPPWWHVFMPGGAL